MKKELKEEILNLLNDAYYWKESTSEHKKRINSVYEQLTIPVVGVTLPTKEEISIEGLAKYPIICKDEGINYSNEIQRNNFINGANWLRDKINDNGN